MKIYENKVIEKYFIDASMFYPIELLLLDTQEIYVYRDKDGEIDFEKVDEYEDIIFFLENNGCDFDKRQKRLLNKSIKDCKNKDSKICGYLQMLYLEI